MSASSDYEHDVTGGVAGSGAVVVRFTFDVASRATGDSEGCTVKLGSCVRVSRCPVSGRLGVLLDEGIAMSGATLPSQGDATGVACFG